MCRLRTKGWNGMPLIKGMLEALKVNYLVVGLIIYAIKLVEVVNQPPMLLVG
jgi:hypothetical protein